MLPEPLSAGLISALTRLPYVRAEDLNGRAASYVRFSTPPQLMGGSQRRQVERATAFIAAHGLTLIDDIRDLGRSAFKGHHIRGGGLGRFLAAVRAGTIQPGTVLVIEALDRLSRLKMSDALELFISILNSGIVIITLMDGAWYSRRMIDENLGQIHQAVRLLMGAHAESRTNSDRGREYWAKVRRNKATRNCPAWLEPDPARLDRFAIIPERAAVVRRIYKEFADGMPVLTIVRKLNRDWRVPCWSRTAKRKAQGWYGPYVRKLLASRAVLGEFELGRMDKGQQVLTSISTTPAQKSSSGSSPQTTFSRPSNGFACARLRSLHNLMNFWFGTLDGLHIREHQPLIRGHNPVHRRRRRLIVATAVCRSEFGLKAINPAA